MSNDPDFPKPNVIKGRLYWRRQELEDYKRHLMRRVLGDAIVSDQEPRSAIEELVPSGQVTKEFGFGRRTLGRRIRPSKVEEA